MILLHVVLLSANLMTSMCSTEEPSCAGFDRSGHTEWMQWVWRIPSLPDEDCADRPVFAPSRLVVEYGSAASVSCTACQHGCRQEHSGLEVSAGETTRNDTVILWRVDGVAEWNLSALCYHTKHDGKRCCSRLPITVYKPPARVSLHFEQQPFRSGYESAVRCTVEDVAPIGNVLLIFYSAHLPVFRHQFSTVPATPASVTESYTVTVRALEESDGSQYWCEARLDLGPEGPGTVLKYASKIRKDDRVPPFIPQRSSGNR